MILNTIAVSPLGAFQPSGDLAARLQLNFNRLEEEKYQPENVFQREKEANNWPGDTEGRTVLALVLLAQATGRQPKYLDAILQRWPREVNEHGYFGTIHPSGVISEQQLSGHGWVLRALSELERWKPRGPARALAEPILENLILPTAGYHREYPLDPQLRAAKGSYSGTQLGRSGAWILSTDVGCDFICLDGIVDAYDVFRDARLAPIIEEMIARFLQFDLVAGKAQTHATLTCCRALLRYAEISGSARLIDEVRQRFDLYRQLAWTEHYANFNWFGRPEWTEPCAIVDSLMVAIGLWQRTHAASYLADAQHIYFNALAHAQRVNGGFGCDNCPGADGEDDLFFKLFEAHWCCTMRGGEGLARMAQYNIFRTGDAVVLPFVLSGGMNDPDWTLSIESTYPEAWGATLHFVPRPSANVSQLVLYIPPWVEGVEATNTSDASRAVKMTMRGDDPWLRLPVDKWEGRWSVTGRFKEGTRPSVNPAAAKKPRVAKYRGPLLLGETPLGSGKLEPIFGAYKTSALTPETSHRRLLWSET